MQVLPALHSVPAVGCALRGQRGWWAFSGDTERNPALWSALERLSEAPPQLPVAALIIETALSNREGELERRSQHLSPATLAAELALRTPTASYPIYITRTKPYETELILQKINQLDLAGDMEVVWLQAGQVFNV